MVSKFFNEISDTFGFFHRTVHPFIGLGTCKCQSANWHRIEIISNLPVPPSFPSPTTSPGYMYLRVYVLNFVILKGVRVGKGQKDITLHPALHGQHPSSWGHAVVDKKYISTQLLNALFTVAYRREKIG